MLNSLPLDPLSQDSSESTVSVTPALSAVGACKCGAINFKFYNNPEVPERHRITTQSISLLMVA